MNRKPQPIISTPVTIRNTTSTVVLLAISQSFHVPDGPAAAARAIGYIRGVLEAGA